jgi:NADPH-dependent 2,4-dienoyl-CoA reductase/sulfur reductase-like enzyme
MTDRPASAFDADVAIIGGGPAGIAAAVCAAEAGRRVVLIDEGLRPGGQIWRHTSRDELPRTAQHWLARLDRSGATVLSCASVVDALPSFALTIEQNGEPRVVTAAAIIIATGARERFLPFPGWTLPGVIGAGGAQALLKSGAVLRGKRAVVAGSGPLLLAVAGALARSGVRVALVAEQAPSKAVYGFAASLLTSPQRIAQAAYERASAPGARYRTGTWVERAYGDDVVREAVLTNGKRRWTEPCDILCVGFGLVPATELARMIGCTVLRGRVLIDERQRATAQGVYCAGEPTGVAGVDSAIVQGEIAGLGAAGKVDVARRRFRARDAHYRFALRLEAAFALRAELRALPDADTIVCRCEDVTFGRLQKGWSARETKLRTRAGMGPCQGRVCGAALEFILGHRPDTVRLPVAPTRLTTLLEQDYAPGGAGELRGEQP